MNTRTFVTILIFVVGISLGLVGVIYKGMAQRDDKQDESIEKLCDEKVDNKTMQMMIEMQSKDTDRLYEEVKLLRQQQGVQPAPPAPTNLGVDIR